eukprot:3595806-Alexandrium_andersonii.AAC.1
MGGLWAARLGTRAELLAAPAPGQACGRPRHAPLCAKTPPRKEVAQEPFLHLLLLLRCCCRGASG